jgi:hypothetical protein
MRMDWMVALRYPNGRVHETVIAASDDFGPGFEFELFGRRWEVVGLCKGRLREDRILCAAIDTVAVAG